MSDANLATIAYAPEIALGTAPTALQELRFTGESLGFEKETVSSQEIRSDRQVSDNQKVHGQPSGSFDFELSYGFILPWLAAALQADWVDIAITASIALNHSTQVATGTAGDFDDVPVGALVKIAGATTPGNNGLKRVIAKAANGSTITFAAGSLTATDGAASLTITGKTIRNGVTRKSHTLEKRILNSDGQDFFQRYRGMVVDTMSLQIESKRIITGSVGMIGTSYDLADAGSDSDASEPAQATGTLTATGQALNNTTVTIGGVVYTFKDSPSAAGEVGTEATVAAAYANLADEINGDGIGPANPFVTAQQVGDTLVVTAIQAGAIGNTITTTTTVDGSWGAATLTGGVTGAAGYDPAETGSVMNGTNNIGTIQMDGAAASDRFKSIQIQIANNVRGKDACGVDGNWDIGLGQFSVTGSINAYFRNNSLPTKIRNHTSFGLEFSVQDAAGNQLFFYMPSVKPASGNPTIEAINTDVMIETSYEAIRGGTENPTGATLIIDAVPA